MPLVLTVFVFRFGGSSSLAFVAAHGLLAVMLSALGYLVWYYDAKLLPAFFDGVEGLLADPADSERLRSKYLRFFRRGYWKTLVVWAPIGPVAFVGNLGYLTAQGIGGPTTLTFWAYGLFACWTTFFTAIGMHVIFTTLRCVAEVSTLAFDIDPMHYDGLGGMSVIGDFTVRSMGIASIGSLGIPFLFELARGGSMEWIIYLSVATYVVSLVGLFVYPTVLASRRAERLRENRLETYRERIRAVDAELESLADGTDPESGAVLSKELERQRLRQQYDELQSVQLYPLSVGVISRFAGSILLPLLFLVLEQFLPQFL